MKNLFFPVAVILFIIISCGPAAENRVTMDEAAKQMSDSIKKGIDSSLNDPVKEISGVVAKETTVNK